MAKVVDKEIKVKGNEYDATKFHYLSCVLLEGRQPMSKAVKVMAKRDAWNTTEIGQEIEVYHVRNKSGDIQMRLVSGASATGGHPALLIGIGFIAFGIFRVIQAFYS